LEDAAEKGASVLGDRRCRPCSGAFVDTARVEVGTRRGIQEACVKRGDGWANPAFLGLGASVYQGNYQFNKSSVKIIQTSVSGIIILFG